MSDLSNAMAKLAGIKQAVVGLMNENVSRNRSGGEIKTRSNYPPDQIQHYFWQASTHLETLKKLLPDLYSDFQQIETWPKMTMAEVTPGQPAPVHFSRAQAERLVRDIDQIFEVRANSELAQPKPAAARRVFLTHSLTPSEWRIAQPFIEKDVGLPTIELAQDEFDPVWWTSSEGRIRWP